MPPAQALRAETGALQALEAEIGTLDRDVDAARRGATVNLQSTTTLQHTIERAEEGRQRIGGELGRLDVEAQDLRIEAERLTAERVQAQETLAAAQAALAETIASRQSAESGLGTARVERDWRVRDARTQEKELAALEGRLRSLQQLEASRAAYGEAARLVLGSPEAGVTHYGSVADHLEVEPGGEKAVEAAFGDLLQVILVATAADAERGLAFVRERNLGRCGFLSADQGAPAFEPRPIAGGAQADRRRRPRHRSAPGADPLGARRRLAGAGRRTPRASSRSTPRSPSSPRPARSTAAAAWSWAAPARTATASSRPAARSASWPPT